MELVKYVQNLQNLKNKTEFVVLTFVVIGQFSLKMVVAKIVSCTKEHRMVERNVEVTAVP